MNNQSVSETNFHSKSQSKFQLSKWTNSLGPGLVYVLAVLGAGDIVSNSTAGAGYRYSLIWVLGITMLFRFVWVNTSAKYVLVTGESLLTGYGRFGHWVPWVILISLVFIRHFGNQWLMLLMGSSAQLLLPLPTESGDIIWSFAFTLVGFSMMFWGGYPIIENFCRVLIAIMGGSLVVAAALSNPNPTEILRGAFVPVLPEAQGLYSSLMIIMALIGTEAGAVTNLTYAYFISEKGWKGVSFLKQQRFDLSVGVICMFLMAGLLQIAAGGTIQPLGIDIEDADDLVRIFSETQGMVGLVIFGLGLWGASFSTFIGASVGQALVFTDICRTFVPTMKQSSEEREPVSTKDPIYRWYLIFFSFSPLYILFVDVSAVWLTLVFTATTVVLIPVLAFPLLKITNDKNLMGRYTNSWFTNVVIILLIVVSIYLTYRNIMNWWIS